MCSSRAVHWFHTLLSVSLMSWAQQCFKALPSFFPSSTPNFNAPFSPIPTRHTLPPYWVMPVQSIITRAQLPLWQPVRVDSPSSLLTHLLSLRVLPGWTFPSLTHIACSSSSSILCLGPAFVIPSFSPVGLASLPIHHPLFLSILIVTHMSQMLKSVHLSPFVSPLLSSPDHLHTSSLCKSFCVVWGYRIVPDIILILFSVCSFFLLLSISLKYTISISLFT